MRLGKQRIHIDRTILLALITNAVFLGGTLVWSGRADEAAPERPADSDTAGETATVQETKSASVSASRHEATAVEPRSSPSGKNATGGLDMQSLGQRLRDSDVLGFFTKLAIKRSIDDLLDGMRAYHNHKSKLTLEQLHERFNLLLLKVVTLLQDKDPALSRAIIGSRPTLWAVLLDPEKLSTI